MANGTGANPKAKQAAAAAARKPARRGGGGGKKASTALTVGAGVGGAIIGGGGTLLIRSVLVDNKIPPVLAGLVSTLVGLIGAAATSTWLRATFIGHTIVATIVTLVDGVIAAGKWNTKRLKDKAAEEKKRLAAKGGDDEEEGGDDEEEEEEDKGGPKREAGEVSDDLLQAIRDEIAKQQKQGQQGRRNGDGYTGGPVNN